MSMRDLVITTIEQLRAVDMGEWNPGKADRFEAVCK